jgi:hypothetical protein
VALIRPVRFAPILIAFFLLALSVAHGQQQESKVMSRMRQDDRSEAFNLSKISSAASRTYSAHSANVKEFSYDQKFSPKDFNVHSYSGAKSFWKGDFKFLTKSTDTKTYATKEAPTKALPVKDATEAGKLMPTREFAGQRAYLKHGPTDHFVDKKGYSPDNAPLGVTSDLEKMSIDDVRNLLNKNK